MRGDHATARVRPLTRVAAFLMLLSPSAHAATCTWSASAEASWTQPANWSGCAAGGGVPAGTPGPADRAFFPAGTGKAVIIPQFISVAELEMAQGTALGLEVGQTDTRQLTILTSATLSGAILNGALPPPGGPNPAVLSLIVPATATLSLNGANTLRRAIITNSGVASISGGTGARLDLDLNGSYINAPAATTTVQGSYVFGYTNSGTVDNQGHWVLQGPGLAKVERSGASGGRFQCSGLFEIRGATFALLNPAAGFQSAFTCSVLLLDGTFDGNTQSLSFGTGKSLSGSGSLIGMPSMTQGSILDPRAANGDAIGALSISGNATFGGTELVLDIGGPAVTQHDRLTVNGSVQWSRVSPRVRIGGGYAPGIDAAFAIASHASVVSPNQPVHERVLSDYPTSFALRVLPTQTTLRVVPTLTVANGAVIEGNSGTQVMNFAVTLSAATSETVSFGYTTFAGTAVSVPAAGSPADYANALGNVTLAPGVLSQQISITINGDSNVEANEAFSLVTNDDQFTPPLTNASFGNNRRFSTRAEGLIQDDDSAAGTRYLLIGKSTNLATPTGQVSFVRRYSTTGVAVDGWATLMQNSFGFIATGFCRAPNGNVVSTRFNDSRGPVLMSAAGTVLDGDFGGLVGADESCAFDQQGNAWIGEAVPVAASTAPLRYVAADGRLLETLQLPVGERGTDWIELDANQCTLYYTSEDSDVRRYDVCTRQVLPNFVIGLEPPCYALRQLPNRDLMITCRNRIYRYDLNGALVREYTRESLGETDSNGLYAVHLDPDGQTFWAGGVISGRVVRARLDDGSVVTSFATGSGGVNGLLIQDEFVAAIATVLFKDGFEP